MMFGSILYEGIKMLKDCEFNDRTMIIVSLAFCVGVGLTQTDANFFSAFPQGCGRYLQRKCCCRCVRSITAAQSDPAER